MDELIILLTGVLGATGTYLAHKKMHVPPVFASAFLSFIVAIACHIFSESIDEYLSKTIPLVFIGASFIGMTSPKIISQVRWIVVSGLIFGVIFLHASNYFSVSGGRLGTVAALSVIISIGLLDMVLLRKNRHQNKLPAAFRAFDHHHVHESDGHQMIRLHKINKD